ncbi:MAG: hypothetical protein NVSMB17_06760 [Candidatus Dormibacteria bacterium]
MSTGDRRPADVAEQLLELGQELQLKGELENAVRLFSQSLRSRPSADGYAMRARVHERLGRFSPALADYREALALDPGCVGALQGIARVRNRAN